MRDDFTHTRRARLYRGRAAAADAIVLFRDGEYEASRFEYLAAFGWFDKAGARALAKRVAAIGEKVIRFQEAGGLPVGAARRKPLE